MNKKCYKCGKTMKLIYRDRQLNNITIKKAGAFECSCGEIIYSREQARYIENQLTK